MTHRDLRILLAAGVWWAASIGTLLQGVGIVITIVVALAGGAVLLRIILRYLAREERLTYIVPTLIVVGAAALLASIVTASHTHLAAQGILSDLAMQKAVAAVEGRVTSYPNPAGDRVLRTLTVTSVEGRGKVSGAHSSVMLVGGDDMFTLELNERVKILVRLEPSDPGSREIAWATVVGRVEVVETAPPVSRWIARRADILASHLQYELPQVQGLVPGLAIGDDSRIPDDSGDALADVNLTHLTAVSGAHVSMVCAIALTLVGYQRRWLSVLVAGTVLAVLIVATGAQPSVLRAGVMGGVVLGAVWLRRPSSALPALGVSIIVLIGFEPTLALAYGFILSVVSTAAIILWARPAAAILAPAVTLPGANLLAVPIVAHVACAPIILLLTETASLWSAVANALVAPIVPAGTIFALGGLIASPVPIVGPALAWLAARCVSWIDIVAAELASWPGSGMDGRVVMAIYLAILIVAWLIAAGRVRRHWVAIAVLGLSAQRLIPPSVPNWDVVQCDVGQGAATLVLSDEVVYLIDTGPPDARLDDCLDSAGVGVDILVLTHLHADHAGLVNVALERGAGQVWAGPGMTDRVAELGVEVPIHEYAAGDRPNEVEILWPEGPVECWDDSCENNQSLTLRFTIGQKFLVTGDLEPDGQRRLAQRDISADIVLIPHHGSPRQDEGFAEAVGASTALLSYGDNTYGHPAPATVDLYATFGTILSTDEGDIFLRIDP